MKSLFLLLGFLFYSTSLFWAQNPPPTFLALDSANHYFLSGKWERAAVFAAEAELDWRRAPQQDSGVLSAIWLLQAKTFQQQGRYNEAIGLHQKNLELQAKSHPEQQALHLEILKQMGLAQLSRSIYLEALHYLTQALAVAKGRFGETHSEYAYLLEKQAQVLLYLGKYAEAIRTLEEALAIQVTLLPPQAAEIGQTCLTLGSYYKRIKKFDTALEYYQKAMAIQLAQPQPDPEHLADLFSQTGQVHLYRNAYEKALYFFQQEDSIMLSIGGMDNSNYLYTCNDMMKAHMAGKNFPEALEWAKKAIEVATKHQSTNNENYATLQLFLGRAQMANGLYEAALQSFFTDERLLIQIYGAENALLYHCKAEIGQAYVLWYLQSGQDSLLQRGRQFFQQAENEIDRLLRKETSREARQRLLYEAVGYFEKAIHAEYLQYQKLPQAASLERAWQLSEKMHGYLLFFAAQEANARQYAGIPAERLQQDASFQKELAELGKKRQKILQNGQHSLTDPPVLELNRQIHEIHNNYLLWQQTLEKDFPAYYRLKYDTKLVSLQEIQRQLQPQQTLLEYFTGDSSLYVFVVHQDGCQWYRIPRDFPLEKWCFEMVTGINAYHSAAEKSPEGYLSSLQQYVKAAEGLYQKLLAPIAGQLREELLIVPGDGLNNLPFEALLSAAPKDVYNFKTFPFLLQKHAVYYAYSATHWRQMSTGDHREQNATFLVAAPFFGGKPAVASTPEQQRVSGNFVELPYSGEEAQRVWQYGSPGSVVWTGHLATKHFFESQAARFDVLHLATHAKANKITGDFSYLAFYPENDSLENHLMTVAEIYNLAIRAKLVTLSACETGVGEQQRGEGALSLARAFAYAGAKSIVASLWMVNDRSTMLIMDRFYAEIQKGKSKNMALAAAKRQYLSENPGAAAHPFFWAGFIGIGDWGRL